jgi:hypothetical protein
MSKKAIQPRRATDSPTVSIDVDGTRTANGGAFQHREQFRPHVLAVLR